MLLLGLAIIGSPLIAIAVRRKTPVPPTEDGSDDDAPTPATTPAKKPRKLAVVGGSETADTDIGSSAERQSGDRRGL
jgi:hypothetical protein